MIANDRGTEAKDSRIFADNRLKVGVCAGFWQTTLRFGTRGWFE